MWFFGKKQSPVDGDAYEEISEKKTTKIGYFLLILMALFIVGISQTVFGDLRSIPERPVTISSCAREFASVLNVQTNTNEYSGYGYDYGYYSNSSLQKGNCTFSTYENESGVSSSITSVEPLLKQYFAKSTEVSTLSNTIEQLKYKRSQAVSNYDISLQERQAQIEGAFDVGTEQNAVVTVDDEIALRQAQVIALTRERDALLAQIQTKVPTYEAQYDKALSLYNKAVNWYRLKVFGLTLLFIIPFFVLSMRYYFRFKKGNSPYTIIAGAIFVASSLLFLQVVGMFLYEIIPHALIQLIIDIFMQVAILRYVLYYGSVVLVILLFGGIVYVIQKRVYNSAVVAIRRLKDHKCPKCSFTLDNTMVFCPRCGYQVYASCEHCHNARFVDLPVCQACGKRKSSPLEKPQDPQ